MLLSVMSGAVGLLVRVLRSGAAVGLVKVFGDKILDFIEDRVMGSASEVDDNLVLPICEVIRDMLGIDDDQISGGDALKQLLPVLIGAMGEADASGGLIRALGDMILDFVEDYVLGTASKMDDFTILPVCRMIRMSAGIPDND